MASYNTHSVISDYDDDVKAQCFCHCSHIVTKLKQENESLMKEIEFLKQLLSKRFAFRKVEEKPRLITGENSAEDIKRNFSNYCDKIENTLPRKLKVERLELWPVCQAIFEESFKQCRDSFFCKILEPLYSLTELSEEEHKKSETDWDRKGELEDVSTAYKYLLAYSKTANDLRSIDQFESIVNKVILSVSNDSNHNLVSKLHDQVEKAVELCWRMHLLPTPMFICQPELYNENWHETHRKSWFNKTNELVYYRPVLMNSAGGSVACKGFIGNAVPNKKINIRTSSETDFGIFVCRSRESKEKMSIFDYITKAKVNSSVKCDHCHQEFRFNGTYVGDMDFLHVRCFQELRCKTKRPV